MKKTNVILLTGGNSRLGKVIADYLVDRGYIVYATSRKSLTSENENLRWLQLDVTSDRDVEKGIATIIKREKRLDVVINNAGVTLTGSSLNYTPDDFMKLLDINLIGPFRVIKYAMNAMIKPKLIINITSLNGYLALPNFGLYCATKFAMEGLGLSLHYEVPAGTQIVNVAPGALKAESNKKMPHKPAREKIPLLNWLLPLTSLKDVAERIEQLIVADSVPARVIIGRDAKLITFMQKVMPFALFDKLILLIIRKK